MNIFKISFVAALVLWLGACVGPQSAVEADAIVVLKSGK